MTPDPQACLRDAEERIDRIDSYLQGKTEEEWTADSQLRDAVERNFEVIGEALRRIRDTAPSSPTEFPGFTISLPSGTTSPMGMMASGPRRSGRPRKPI